MYLGQKRRGFHFGSNLAPLDMLENFVCQILGFREGDNTGGDVLEGVENSGGPPSSGRLTKGADQEPPQGSTDVLHSVKKLGWTSHSGSKHELH